MRSPRSLNRPLLALLSSAALVLVAGCGARTLEVGTSDAGAPEAAVPATGQTVLFEAAYSNWAWGFTFNGIHVDANGEVWSYAYPAGTASPDPGYVDTHAGITEAELRARYAHDAKLIRTLTPDELAAAYAKVSVAEQGALLTQGNCADAGVWRLSALKFDSTTATYAPVVIAAMGDQAQENTAPAAAELVTWLRGLGGFEGIDSCSFHRPNVCVGASCSAPTCTKDWLVGTCDGQCVSPTWCASVDDCARCPSGLACVRDEAGRAHCTAIPGCASGANDCRCVGDQVCAGGAAWCQRDGDAFACVRPSP